MMEQLKVGAELRSFDSEYEWVEHFVNWNTKIFGNCHFEASANLPCLRFLWETPYERSHLLCRTWILHRVIIEFLPNKILILHILQLVLLLFIFFHEDFGLQKTKWQNLQHLPYIYIYAKSTNSAYDSPCNTG